MERAIFGVKHVGAGNEVELEKPAGDNKNAGIQLIPG